VRPSFFWDRVYALVTLAVLAVGATLLADPLLRDNPLTA